MRYGLLLLNSLGIFSVMLYIEVYVIDLDHNTSDIAQIIKVISLKKISENLKDT